MNRRPDVVLDDARRGEPAALAQLWRTHQAQLLRYLRVRRIHEPADVASQVWIDVAGSIARFQGNDEDFRRWLFTIAHRRSVDHIRRSVRRSATLAALDAAGSSPSHDADEPDVVLERETGLDRALAMLGDLPPDMAEAVSLRVIGDLPFADVATIMSCTEGNARVLVHRGLKRLSQTFAVTKPDAAAMDAVQ